MGNGTSDLTIREVFNRLVDTQDKSIEAQRESAEAIVKMADVLDDLREAVDKSNSKTIKLLTGIAIAGWIIAGLALGIDIAGAVKGLL